MKKLLSLLSSPSTLYIYIVLMLLSCGCSHNVQRQYRIGVSQCLDDAWRQKMNYEMNRELLLHPEMTLSIRVAHGSNDLQCAQIDSFISEHVDLLIVSPNEAEEVKPAVTRAYRSGIPVIVADRRVTGNEWTAFIGGDNYKVGTLMGEWIIDRYHEQKRDKKSKRFVALEVAGLPGSTPATLRHQGMTETLSQYDAKQQEKNRPALAIEVHTVLGDWQKADAYSAVSEYIQAHPSPDVIVAQNDLMAIGAAEAISNYNLAIPIMGVDGIILGLQAIEAGIITCSATYSSRGDMVIETASKILNGRAYVKDTVLQTTLVDKTAAQALLIQHQERVHDLETLQMVWERSDEMRQEMRADKNILSIAMILMCLLFCVVVAFILFRQQLMGRVLKDEVVPQLEDVQEAIRLSGRDEAFAERLQKTVDEHISNPNLSVEYLGSLLQLSRTQVFRRVKSVTGKGPLDYIRERRLIHADELLHKTDMTIQQVALQFCFSSAGYFTKCYKDYFGHLPSERR